MDISVRYKLFLVILATACMAVLSSTLIAEWSLERGYIKLVNSMEQSSLSHLAVTLENEYRNEKSWDFLRNDPQRWQAMVARSLPEAEMPPGERFHHGPPPPSRPGNVPPHFPPPPGGDSLRSPLPPPLNHQLHKRLFLLDENKKAILHAAVPSGNAMTPISCQGKVVGYLGLSPRTDSSEMPHKRFLKEQKQELLLQAMAIVALAAVLSLLMTRRLVRPLHELAQATHQLAAGTFSVRVPVGSRDELGQLAQDFNSLALSLEQSEQVRKQWVADISHELRTPLAILQGEIEALQDGIRQPDAGAVKSLHNETLRLGRLVDDLFQLSLSDAGALTYRKTDLDLIELLRETLGAYQPRYGAKGIGIETEMIQEDEVVVFGDRERLRQLFSNVLDNSLKYTDAGGVVMITVERHENRVSVVFADSAPGVPPFALERLFDRLYRVGSSRNRSTGGAGLGLAICRNIVEAHGGTITAQPSTAGGLMIRIELPEVWS